MEVMHILQATRNSSQLKSTSVRLLKSRVTTYELDAVDVHVHPNEPVDVPIFHPLGNHRELVFVDCNPKQG